ncbi:MAG TPA: GMC family oxidoreductase N-terminal domain-containing protein [Hyphomicrobiales bacterium]|nr:GMC family oxidoreductase N-terminal domain-containing protein [Hyphomicrobiales bacterium]
MRSFDYVVVGGGSAGCVLASRLTEDADVTVLLLEAGKPDRHPLIPIPIAFGVLARTASVNWGYETEPEPGCNDRRIPLPRGKTLGGSSSINGLLCLRGHPRDYDQWRQMGLAGWGYADVLPYFRKLESSWRGDGPYHGGDGPITVTELNQPILTYDALAAAARNAGVPVTDDIHGSLPEGVARAEVSTRNGVRASTARSYLAKALGRPNLTVETGALTSRVLVENGRAAGVEYVRDGQRQTVHAEREVILSGGSYNSPQILLLSGIGPADELKALGIAPIHDLPGVGKNLSEHPLTPVSRRANADKGFVDHLRLDRATLSVLQWKLFGSGPFATNSCAANIFLRTRPELERPDIQLICTVIGADAKLWFPGVTPTPPRRFGAAVCLLHPDSRGHMTLRSTDPAAAPRIFLNMLTERRDVESLVAGIRKTREIYTTSPMKELVAEELFPGEHVRTDAEIEAHLRRVIMVTHHPVGTCSMGTGPMAVVDPELRLHGLDGLRVVDASVMPTVPGGNTNLPTIMLAEKAADLIRGRAPLPAEMPERAAA